MDTMLIGLREIGAISDGKATILIMEVNGEALRDLVPRFVEGGNPAVYDFIKAMTIWIERVMTPKDKAATIVHEIVQYALMRLKKLSYERAHSVAEDVERSFRAQVHQVDAHRVVAEAGAFLDRSGWFDTVAA
jgi:hypothetical protein